MKSKVLIILFTFLFAALGCSGESGPHEGYVATTTTSVSNHLTLLPETTHLLIYANVNALKDTPFGQGLAERMDKEVRMDKDDQDYLEFKEATGFAFERDVQEIWISGGNRNESGDHDGGAVVRGHFDTDKIIDYAINKRRHRVREQEFEGHKIYVSEDEENNFSFCFLNDQTAVLGSEQWLKTIILQKASDKSIVDNEVMSKFLTQIPNKNYLWGAIDLGDSKWTDNLRRHGSPFKGVESLEKMKSLVFYTNVDKKAELIMTGDFTTTEEAELFADMLNGFKAMAKMMVSDDKEAVDMLNEIRIKTDGADLQLTMHLDKDFFDKWEQKRRKFDKIEL
jgi:hypothetical protein